MSGDGQMVVYNFSGIDNTSALVEKFVSEMNETLESLTSEFRALLQDGWTGAGAGAFGECHARWTTSANDLAASLRLLAVRARDAAINMQEADNQAAAGFHY